MNIIAVFGFVVVVTIGGCAAIRTSGHIKGFVECGVETTYSTTPIELKDGVYHYTTVFGTKKTAPAQTCSATYF